MSGSLLLFGAIALVASDTASFAIACKGTSRSRGTMSGRLQDTRDNLGEQVFVFDQSKQRADRASIPRQEFDSVCSFEGVEQTVYFSPGLITVTSDESSDSGMRTVCSLEVNRMNGSAKHVLRFEWPDKRYHELTWDMTCRSTATPVFDLSKRKF